MKEIIFDELGYFTESECEKIKKVMEFRTYMNFKVKWSNCAGNCTLIVETDYDENTKEIHDFFISALIRYCI